MRKLLIDVFSVLSRRERIHVLGLLVLMLLGAWAETLGIGIIVPFVGLLNDPTIIHKYPLFETAYTFIHADSERDFMFMATLLLMAVIILKNLLISCINYLQTAFIHAKEVSLSCWVFKRYMYAPYTFHLQHNSSDLIRVISIDVPRVTSGFLQPLLVGISEVLVMTGIALLLAIMSPLATGVAFLILGCSSVLLSSILRRKLSCYRSSVKTHGEAAQRWVSQALGAQKEIRIFDVPGYFERKLESDLKVYAKGYASFTFLNQSPRLVLESVVMTLMLSSIAVFILKSENTREAIPILALFALATVRIMPSVTKIIGSINSMKFYAPAFSEVIKGIRNVPDGPAITAFPDNFHRRGAGGSGPEIRLEHVWYRHPGVEEWILKDLNFGIPAGKCTAIVGFSGAGKSTVAELLLGLLKPDRGAISITRTGPNDHGVPIRFAYVPQSPYLLDDTVRRNIAFGIPDDRISDPEIISAIESVNLAQRLLTSPRALDETVGERGARLSGGERQRLAIARALYRDPDVIVFDEATSALDQLTESEISDTILKLAGEKTVIVITHSLNIAARFEKIIFLENGCVSGVGTFHELLSASESFRRMAGIPQEE